MTEFYSLTTGEENLMQLLWELQTFYLKDVIESHPEPKPHQNTISTYLKLLAEKNFIKSEKEGRILKYKVTVPRNEYREFLLKNLLQNYGFTSREIIQILVRDNFISPEDFGEYFNVRVVVSAEKDILGKAFERNIFPPEEKGRKKKKKKK